jgi:methylated-DNA-protein-cysteine methyltransferase-like protein
VRLGRKLRTISPVNSDNSFRNLVYEYVAEIPQGRVMTYGQLAALCGHPRAARIVGAIAHFGPDDLPWHRVVYKDGRLAGEFPGGRSEQAKRLEEEGLKIQDLRVNIEISLWWPQQK